MLTVATAVIMASPFTSAAEDRIVSLVVAATFATGAIVSSAPRGFRLILMATSVACVVVTFMDATGPA